MAGGEGARLRPLTCDRPKPLVPVCNRPVLAYILDLLRTHGFREVHLTLGYHGEQIQTAVRDGLATGLSLHVSLEREPLGTAGSVAALRAALTEPFLVISGDALTDMDLTALVQQHRRSGAAVTLALHRAPNPLEYGVVLTAPDGRIARFLEKPGWGEAFSDTVNTGIYVMNPEVLKGIPPGRCMDFSRAVFPALLQAGAHLQGWLAPGYWCDIGDLKAYLQANLDLLAGRLSLTPPGREVAPGLWLEGDAEIAEGVEIRGPALVGPGCRLGRGARLADGVVLGAGAALEPHASLKRSVVWAGVWVGARAALRGAVAAGGARVGDGASAYEGAVLGPDCVLEPGATLRPGVRLWPGKCVPAGATLHHSVVWGDGRPAGAPAGCLRGRLGVDLLPEEALRVGTALGAVLEPGALAVGADPVPAAQLLKQALAAGMLAAGRPVVDTGRTVAPVTAWAVRHRGAAGGCHVRGAGGELLAVLLDARGLPLGREAARKLEGLLARADFPRAGAAAAGSTEAYLQAEWLYLEAMTAALDAGAVRRRRLRLGLAAPEGWVVASRWADRLGVALVPPGHPADLAAGIDPLRATWWLAGPEGFPLGEEVTLALTVLLELHGAGGGDPVLPVTAPRALEGLCARFGRHPRRVRLADYHPGDPLLALGRLLEWMAQEGLDQAALLERLPPLPVRRLAVPCPWAARARVMRRLLEEHPGQVEEMLDGLRLRGPGGHALLLPDPEQPLYRVYGEGDTPEAADAVARYFGERVAGLADEGD